MAGFKEVDPVPPAKDRVVFSAIVSDNREYFWNNGIEWCIENIGPIGCGTWSFSWPRIAIYDADTAFAFKMRWC